MTQWNSKSNASNWWYLAGVAGSLGSLIAIIYVLTSKSKMRVFSLLFLIGILGPAVVYFVTNDQNNKLADLSKKLLLGNILILVIFIIIWISFATLIFGLAAK